VAGRLRFRRSLAAVVGFNRLGGGVRPHITTTVPLDATRMTVGKPAEAPLLGLWVKAARLNESGHPYLVHRISGERWGPEPSNHRAYCLPL
jgi:hypothetical protein